MATDIAEFLKKNFLERVQEKDLLSLSPAITSLLNDIKKEFTENERNWSPPPYYSLSCFYQLDYALAECQAYKHQTKSCLERTFSKFSSDLEPDLKKMLSETRDELIQIRKKDPEFLKKNFLERVQEKELRSVLPAIISLLDDIKKEFTENERYWSSRPYGFDFCFHQLGNALAQCQAYKHQTKTSLKRTLSPFSSDLEPDLKNMLSNIRDELIEMRQKDSDSVNENSSSSIFTSTDSPTKKGSSYFPGFDEEIPEKILKWLENNNGFKAIGIHGMCGTGKTTLVKEILNNERVRGKYAEPIWVCLSDTTSEEIDIRIVNEILLSLNDDPDLLTEEPEDNFLVERLRGKLNGQKYLIVLDGVWHCNDWFSNLRVDEKPDSRTKLPFSMALPKDTGGAVIVTSRVKEVTKQLVGENNLIHIQPWDDENMKKFVRQCLKRSGDKITDDKMFDEVVYHCQGLPLVAETLSGWIAEQIAAYQNKKAEQIAMNSSSH